MSKHLGKAGTIHNLQSLRKIEDLILKTSVHAILNY